MRYGLPPQPAVYASFFLRRYVLLVGEKAYPSMPCGMLGAESLFALYQAAQMLELSGEDVENIFYYNAIRLFQLEN